MAWRLNSFFGCARLDTGGRVIGGVQLVFSLTGIAIAILGIIGAVMTINNPKASHHDVSTAKSENWLKPLHTKTYLIVLF